MRVSDIVIAPVVSVAARAFFVRFEPAVMPRVVAGLVCVSVFAERGVVAERDAWAVVDVFARVDEFAGVRVAVFVVAERVAAAAPPDCRTGVARFVSTRGVVDIRCWGT